jgi:hypothetical protein
MKTRNGEKGLNVVADEMKRMMTRIKEGKKEGEKEKVEKGKGE